MSETIESFEAGEGDAFGDILSERPTRRGRIKVGLLAVAYFEYWRMFSRKFKNAQRYFHGWARRGVASAGRK